jgi:non-ribosomal peptide synthetase-like protein
MVPSHLDLIEELPRLTSGKVDRNNLPEPITPLVKGDTKIVSPRTELERKILGVWEEILETKSISVEDDFFLDLGGYSLLAVMLQNHLREKHGYEISLREVYEHPTISSMAEYIESKKNEFQEEVKQLNTSESRQTSQSVFNSLPRFQWHLCIGLQFLSILALYGLMATPFMISILTIGSILEGRLGLFTGVSLLVGLVLVWFPFMFLLSIVLKWVIIGRYRPGKYPLWGLYHFRLWLISRVQSLSGIGFMAGTPVMSIYYRLMGAKIGRNCIIDTSHCITFDLISIGDETCIASETQLLGYHIEDGMLHIGRVDIGSRCFVGIHSSLGIDTRMEDDTCLGDLSLLPDREVITEGESRYGAPAIVGDVSLPEVDDSDTNLKHPIFFGIIHLFLAGFTEIFVLLTLTPSICLVAFAYQFGGLPWLIISLFLSIPINVISFFLLFAALKVVVLPHTKPGTYHVESWFFLRKWLIDSLMKVSRVYMRGIYTTIYLPPLLRLLGAKIGHRTEISTVSQVAPDLIEIDDESFFADGSMIGGRHFFRGHIQVGQNSIGRRSFVGNNAILPIDNHLGPNCLLGVLSTHPQAHKTTPDGSEWLGSPSFILPYRRKIDSFDTTVTYTPIPKLYVQRLLIDGIRILVPHVIVILGGITLTVLFLLGLKYLPVSIIILLTPIVTFLVAIEVALLVVLLKWIVMGRFEPVIKPLWCTYVWWNEVINGAYETVGAPTLMPLFGTPFFNWYLRRMGCKIGKRTYIGTSLFSEFDLVEIGNYVALNEGVVVQNHLFEDRIMKSSYIKIGNECSVGNMTVIIYDTKMEQGSSVGPLSLLMKGETLPPFTKWIGIPTSRHSI